MKAEVCNKTNPCMGFYGDCLDVKITNACNGRCAFCIERDGFSPEPAPVEELIQATNNAKCSKVLILGGEPFLYPHLLDYVAGIYGHKDEIFVTTNGSCFPSADKLAKLAKLITGVNISIHHYFPMENDRILGTKVVFQDVADAVAVLKRAGAQVRINCNLIKTGVSTRADVEVMTKFAKSLQADGIRFAEIQNCPDLFVPAQACFNYINRNPFTEGCEQDFTNFCLPVKVRLTCGVVNPAKPKPMAVNTTCCHPRIITIDGCHIVKTKVLYPNAQVFDGWVSSEPDCHSNLGCHSTRRGG